MPAYVGSALACKLVSFYPENAIKGIPTHQATVLLFDEATGRLKAVHSLFSRALKCWQ